MDFVILIGRIMFVAVFFMSAIGHFTQGRQMAGFARAKRVPFPELAVYGGGVLLVLGGLSVLLGIWPDLGALLLVIFLVPTAIMMHNFWTERDPQARYLDQIQFFKDMGLAGAALMLFGLFIRLGDDLGLVITGPLFG